MCMPGEAGETAVAGQTPIGYMTVCALKAAVCITGVVNTDNSQSYSGSGAVHADWFRCYSGPQAEINGIRVVNAGL